LLEGILVLATSNFLKFTLGLYSTHPLITFVQWECKQSPVNLLRTNWAGIMNSLSGHHQQVLLIHSYCLQLVLFPDVIMVRWKDIIYLIFNNSFAFISYFWWYLLRYLVSTGGDGTVCFWKWDLATLAFEWVLKMPTAELSGVLKNLS